MKSTNLLVVFEHYKSSNYRNISVLLLFVIIIFTFNSCEVDSKPKKPHVKIKKDSSFTEIAELPIEIDNTNYLLFPIGKLAQNKLKGIIYKSASYPSQSFSVSNYQNYRIYGNLSNVKFQHKDSVNMTYLTKNVIKIKSITFLEEIYKSTKKQFLVYEIIDNDTNKDGKLDFSDVKTLYISKINGSNFLKLTKDGESLIDWKIIKLKDRLYFRTIEDTNKDGEFDKKDIIHYQFVDLGLNKLEVNKYKGI